MYFLVSSFCAVSQEGGSLIKSIERQADRAKEVFAKPRRRGSSQEIVRVSEKEEQKKILEKIAREKVEIAKLEAEKRALEKQKIRHHEEEIDRISDQKRNPFMWKVASWIDHRDNEALGAACDSMLDVGSLSDEAIRASALIAEYADTYKDVPYEDLSLGQVQIRWFVTFANDPGPHPANEFYGHVWETNFFYCYGQECFNLSEPREFTLVDLNHKWSPPIDQYTGSRKGGAVSRGYYDKGKWNTSKSVLVTDREYMHGGVDLRFNDTQDNPNIYAVWDGVVRYAGLNGTLKTGFGYMIVIRHYNGAETSYAHNSELKVKVGDHVKAGDVIALGGGTGQGTAPHLDFKVSFRGRFIDPESIFNFANNPKYDNQGVPLGSLFAHKIRVVQSDDVTKHKYRKHSVAIVAPLNPKLSKAFSAHKEEYSSLSGNGESTVFVTAP